MTPAQCRAARGLLNITQAYLAEISLLSRKTVADFEQGARSIHRRSMKNIEHSLRVSGVEMIEASGVRLLPVEGAAYESG